MKTNRFLCASILLFFVILFTNIAHAANMQEATGEGSSKEQALYAAMRQAVEKEAGVYIQSSTTVLDAAVLEDKIFSHSRGYVTSHKIIKEGRTGDGYFVTILASIDQKLVKDDINALTILRKSVGNPRILVVFNPRAEGSAAIKGKNFVEEINDGIEEALSDRQFRVVDRNTAAVFSSQLEQTHDIDTAVNKAAAFGLKYNAEYTLFYGVDGDVTKRADSFAVNLRVKARLIDNTLAQVITNKTTDSPGEGRTAEQALEKAGRAGGKEIVEPIIAILQRHWMDMQQNGSLYIVVLDGVDDPEEIAKFTEWFEKYPRVNNAREVESGGGKTTFEAAYRGKKDELDRDVLRTARLLNWKLKKIRAEGARTTWKKQ
ncbi:MAG TPA: hypothetical protein PLP16_10775 [Smithellaceae bacterium]|nr:hypothetical protein [Smithellaceae bacterium]